MRADTARLAGAQTSKLSPAHLQVKLGTQVEVWIGKLYDVANAVQPTAAALKRAALDPAHMHTLAVVLGACFFHAEVGPKDLALIGVAAELDDPITSERYGGSLVRAYQQRLNTCGKRQTKILPLVQAIVSSGLSAQIQAASGTGMADADSWSI